MDETEPEPVTERWAAMGTRIMSDGSRSVAWLPPGGGKPRYWNAPRNPIVGGIYRLTITYHDGRLTRHGDPQYTGERYPDTDKVAEWELNDSTARRQLAARSLERSAKRQTVIDEAAAPLLTLAARLPWESRDALVSYLSRKIYRAGKRRETP